MILALATIWALGQKLPTSYELITETQPVYRKTVFLGIGVDVDHLTEDRFAESVSEMSQELVKTCSQQQSQLILSTNATAQEIEKKLSALAYVNRSDRVIVDVVCHGVNSNFRVAGGSLPMQRVKELFLKIPANHKLLIADGCDSSSLLNGAAPWNPPASWKDAIEKPCAIVVSSVPPTGNPASVVGGTEFHNRLIQEIDKVATFGKTTVLSDVLQPLKPRIGSLTGNGLGDIILAGDTSRNPSVGQTSQNNEDLANEDGARALIEKDLTQLQRVSYQDAQRYADMVKAVTFLPTADKSKRIADAKSWTEKAASVFTKLDYPKQYADLKFNLAYSESAIGQGQADRQYLLDAKQNYREAASCYQNLNQPVSWAGAQVNLGTISATLYARSNDAVDQQDAIDAYESALTVFTKQSSPDNWALTEDSLAGVLEAIGQRRGDRAMLQKAVDIYREVLSTNMASTNISDAAIAENNLGNALIQLGKNANNQDLLKEGVEAYCAGIEMYSKLGVLDGKSGDNVASALAAVGSSMAKLPTLPNDIPPPDARSQIELPTRWATTEDSLGLALQVIGGQTSDVPTLREAIKAFRAALQVLTKDSNPFVWAATESNLGIALDLTGEALDDRAMLEDAKAAFNLSLEVTTKADLPSDWADTMVNMGAMLRYIGHTDGDTKVLQQAVQDCRDALTVRDKQADGMSWALNLFILGGALADLGAITHDKTTLEDAAKSYQSALDVYTEDAVPMQCAQTNDALSYVYAMLDRKDDEKKALLAAASAYDKAGDHGKAQGCRDEAGWIKA